MASDFMTALFQNNTSTSPGTYRPPDAYHWLEDSDEEADKSKNDIHSIARVTDTVSRRYDSPLSSIDLRKSNGKRASQELSSPVEAPSRKRMRVDNRQHGVRPPNEEVISSARPWSFDLNVSPPPTHRTGYGQQMQNSHPAQVLQEGARSQINQPTLYTNAAAGNHHRSANARDPTANTTMPQKGPWIVPQRTQTTAPPLDKPAQPTIKQVADSRSPLRLSTPTICGPFVIDDSSDDEGPAKAPQSARMKLQARCIKPKSRATTEMAQANVPISSEERECQLVESAKRRQEAVERKRETPSSFGLREDDDETDFKLLPIKPEDRITMAMAIKPHTKDSLRPSLKTPSSPKDSAVDLASTRNTNAPSFPPGSTRQPRTHNAATSVIPHSDDKYKRVEESVEAQRKKNAELHAQLQAIQEKKRKDAEAQKVAAAKAKEQQEQQRARVKQQDAYNKQLQNRAEAAQRSRAIVEAGRKLEAQKKADAQKEAGAKRKEQEKRRLEQSTWDEQKKFEDTQRDALRKRQAEAEKEKGVLDDRRAALARLSAVRPPQPLSKPHDQVGGGAADINQVVDKHAAPQGLRFKNGDGSSAADAARKKVKEIQDRNAQNGLFETKSKSESEQKPGMTERDRRIKMMEERNTRLREAEEKEARESKEEQEGVLVLENHDRPDPRHGPVHRRHSLDREQKRDSRAPTPSSPTTPKGPQSLSSAAGQALLARANVNGTNKSKPVPEKNSREYHYNHYGRQLSEILPEDIQLVHWRDNGMRFQDVEVLFGKRFDSAKTVSTLRKRYKQVKEALKDAAVEHELLDSMLEGSREAAERVNRKVHGRRPIDLHVGSKEVERSAEGRGKNDRGRAMASERQRDAKGHFLPVAGESGGGDVAKPKATASGRSLIESFDSSTTEATLAHEQLENRPQTGGKTMSAEVMKYYLESMAEAWEESHAAESISREPSPEREEDRRRFGFFVQRREITQGELDQGFELGDSYAWANCDDELEDVDAANAKAAAESYCAPEAIETKIDLNRPFSNYCETLKHGCRFFKQAWEGAGEIEVRVVRGERYFRDGLQPQSKARWIGRTLYIINHRQVERAGYGGDDEDLFAEKKETDVTSLVGNSVYSSLEEANVDAIKHFVSIAFSPTSGHLTQRAIEVRAVEDQLKAELEEAQMGKEDEVVFWKEIESEDGKSRVEVWVAEIELKGPRNL